MAMVIALVQGQLAWLRGINKGSKVGGKERERKKVCCTVHWWFLWAMFQRNE